MTITITAALSPTVKLPPTKKIPLLPLGLLEEALSYLRILYNPPVRGSRPISRRKLFPPSEACTILLPPTNDSPLDCLRRDKFERSYAMRWLTSLISQILFENIDSLVNTEDAAREALMDDAASLLAICAGTASAGILTRTFAFGRGSVMVDITDVPLENCDFSTVGAQTWGGSCVLAEIIIDNPRDFGLAQDSPVPLRILELGAGTGLVSIALARYLSICNRSASICSTDFNPTVLTNLANNILTNTPSLSPSVSLNPAFLDWSEPEIRDPQLDGTFDLILGADIIYEMQHTIWIKSRLERLLRKPGQSDVEHPPQFHLVLPLRASFTLESSAVEDTFPFAHGQVGNGVAELAIVSKEVVVCEVDGDGKDAEVEYAYYVIGWQGRTPTDARI